MKDVMSKFDCRAQWVWTNCITQLGVQPLVDSPLVRCCGFPMAWRGWEVGKSKANVSGMSWVSLAARWPSAPAQESAVGAIPNGRMAGETVEFPAGPGSTASSPSISKTTQLDLLVICELSSH